METPGSAEDPEDFSLSGILKPGSSLHPTFLLVLDVAFAVLLAILGSLVILTRGNIHLFVLMMIELCLWASVKWVVHELKRTPPTNTAPSSQHTPAASNKDKQD
ncbi:hypothetical protein PUNSTDRAFT_112384 [Punctularia strigosozonata HHB-11173 SS5]|uniref:uncharacterized protein n=1 Tax=Punctularia strigosozonata (strain HHB-11173) TaxID=741275 RepID=UPI00044183E9|nr:uncharacterized protein PUNSTDRAFT_112384 [Punctularia strigosozonata HHB-11173 SS5]EIN10545.1 hypothetical protein PUNSTDRAFT_112384 [Punctularia strigosozonata HHB-11173 SS5]